MQEKLTYERLYDLIVALIKQIPSLFQAFGALPYNVQQIVLSIVLILAVPTIVGAVLLVEKLWKWWADRH